MVHDAATVRWPRLSPEVAELFRRGAEAALDPRAEWIEELHAAALGGDRMRPVAADPVLAEATKRANLANLLHWAAQNVRHPGRRVPANTGPEALDAARDMVRRGLDERGLDAYRTAQSVAWRRWMEICFELTSDPVLLRELLDASALSISTFIDDTVAAVSRRMEAERAELTRGASAERRAAVTLLLEGAPIGRARAEAQLGYGLAGPHTAAIVWSVAGGAFERLEAAAETVMRAAGATHRLTVVAGAAALWVWFPTGTAPREGHLTQLLAAHPDVRVAVGRPGTDVDGFRRSHLDAAAAQRMLTRLTSPQQVARYEDVQLVALLTAEPTQAEEFLADTLGGLLHADAATQETVLTYVREQCSTTRTAQRLYTHRNTVLRRLARADELLPRPLPENVVSVGAALEVLRWRRT
ncbi:PucR family transcriptional regulator [Dactylosporangium aurantiacum]|uniref:PucR family transcriptional regulator n=1 Tax=Dactylosporangium aurantiacum TaxID=35754 RepID=A0A9Q9IFJ4_9ACTN|nr:PucR family transcriptional regulator [Dactylosporangium aurantiacum]MDG6101730.1 PucR family transcriptional regulator [Dactylosporangium aurantiacum]UWZ52459.1 PucR family transcriptional regulator [Dactylosporangium aurantiacum]